MAIVQAMANSFKVEILRGMHDFTTNTGDEFAIALYTDLAVLDGATTVYTTTNEVVGTGYTAGGKTLTKITPALDGNVALCDFNDVTWSGALFTARGALIYNRTEGNRAVAVLNFGTNRTVQNGDFTLQFPTADASSAIIRLG